MPIVRTLKSWTPVKYDGEITTKDNAFQYLSAFEELDDYEIANDNFENTKKPKTTKKRKHDSLDARISDDANNEKGDKPLKKKRRKAKPKETNKNAREPLSPVSTSAPEPDNLTNFDMSAWDGLFVPEVVLRALKELRFSEPTEIQKLSLPHAIRDRLDILGAAETGSGKTLAFGIPIVAGLLSEKGVSDDQQPSDAAVGPKALILSPTRELALQIKEHITAIVKYTNIKIASVVGGLSVQKQERLLKKRPDILIATPGRLWALISEDFDYVKDLYKTVRFLAIDETDRMVEKGHFTELSSILNLFRKDPVAAQKRQTFVFSATLTYVHPPPKRLATGKQAKQMKPEDKIKMLVSLTGMRKKHKVVDVTRRFGTAEGLMETRLNCGNLMEKDTYLYYFLKTYPGRTLIFTNSIDAARRLRSLLNHLRFQPLILHAQLHQKQRLKNLERFSGNEESILLATDVASRGLDIKNIEHVIHYQVPRTPEIYVHRSGRTARANRQGLSVMLVDAKDVSHYRRICRNLNRDKDLDVFPVDVKVLQMAKERMQLAIELESIEHKAKREQVREKWFERVAKEAELDDDDPRSTSTRSQSDTKKSIQVLQRRLNLLLDVPIKKKAPVTKYPSAYQMDAIAAVTAQESSSNAALDAVQEAKEEEKRLLKKIGRRRVKRSKKGKKKIKRK